MIDMTDHFHNSNLIEGFDSVPADECLKEAWNYLIKQKIISKTTVCRTQKIATLHQQDLQPDWRGYYRKIPVYIGGREALDPKLIDEKMKAWLWRLNDEKLLKAIPMHIDFEHIHPFVDGNGRTGRLLMWWQQVQDGEDPKLITYDDRFEYYKWFR